MGIEPKIVVLFLFMFLCYCIFRYSLRHYTLDRNLILSVRRFFYLPCFFIFKKNYKIFFKRDFENPELKKLKLKRILFKENRNE